VTSERRLEAELTEAVQEREEARKQAALFRAEAEALKGLVLSGLGTISWLTDQRSYRLGDDRHLSGLLTGLKELNARYGEDGGMDAPGERSDTAPHGDVGIGQGSRRGSQSRTAGVEEASPTEAGPHDAPWVREALGGLVGQCLAYRSGSYWSYEVCSEGHVRQYRQGAGTQRGKEDGVSSFSLGRYHSTEVKGEQGALLEHYQGGSACGAMRQERSTTVRWQCGSVGANPHLGTVIEAKSARGRVTAAVSDITEPSPCNYLVEVYTQALC